jgi:hypothetical protein
MPTSSSLISRRFRSARLAGVLLLLVGLSACGYTLQNSRHSDLADVGVRRVFVAPVVNDTYQPGVEVLLYNETIRSLSSEGMVEVSGSLEAADAVLRVRVREASTRVLANTPASNLFPSGLGVGLEGPRDRVVATVYNATLGVEFSLERTRPEPRQSRNVWRGLFNRSKAFPGTNQLGAMGTTSALINESEFDRALQEMARSLVTEAHTNMLLRF